MLSTKAKRAITLVHRRRFSEACRVFEQVVVREPQSGEMHRLYGLALREVGFTDAAIAQLKIAVLLDRDMNSMRALAETLHLVGQLGEARQCLEAMHAHEPNDIDTLNSLSAVAVDEGRDEDAATVLKHVLARAPENATALTLFGKVGLRLGYVEAAQTALLKAKTLVPYEHAALCRLGDELCNAELHEEALPLYDAALRLDPHSVPALGNKAAALLTLGQTPDALKLLQKADGLQPNTPAVINLLGQAWRNLGNLDRAESACRHALRLQPHGRAPRANWATLLLDQGLFKECLDAIQVLTAEWPNDAELERFEALLLLILGRFREGWPKLEARLRIKAAGQVAALAPRWAGEPVMGKRLLITAEEGFGDTIQFIRYATLLAAQGAEISVRAHPSLGRLLRSVAGVHAVFTTEERPGGFDLETKMLSIPRNFETQASTIPGQTPYLSVDNASLVRWRKYICDLSGDSSLLRVGLVWAGNPKHRNNHNRSIEWGRLRRLTEVPGVAFYSLQIGAAREDLAHDPRGVIDLAPGIQDYYDTAAAVTLMDLIISVDTSVAHLAGAMARPVWTLLPITSDWRWLLGREDSPWYPTMRLFRQTSRQDWEEVVSRICLELRHVAERHAANYSFSGRV